MPASTEETDDHGDSASTATPLEIGASGASGVIETVDDVDFFAFRAEAGRTYAVILPNRFLDTVFYDLYGPYFELIDSDGTSKLAYDAYLGPRDAAGGQFRDDLAVWTSQRDGTYYVRVSNQDWWGDPPLQYRIFIILDDSGNDRLSAKLLSTDGQILSGRIDYFRDADFFTFDAKAGHAYVIEATGVDPWLILIDSEGDTLRNVEDSHTSSERIEWTCELDGTYYVIILISPFSNLERPTGAYEISVADTTTPLWGGSEVEVVPGVSGTPLVEDEIHVPEEGGSPVVIDRLIVKATAGVTRDEMAVVLAQFDGGITGQDSLSNWYEVGVLSSTLSDLERLRAELDALPQIEVAEIERLFEATGVPVPLDVELARGEDGMYWSDRINLPGAARFLNNEDANGDPRFARLGKTLVAVTDSGIDALHPDLDDALTDPQLWANFSLAPLWSSGDIEDNSPAGHGTLAAGLIAAEIGNADDCSVSGDGCFFGRFNGTSLGRAAILPIKDSILIPNVGDSTTLDYTTPWALGNSIQHAATVGAEIINISLGNAFWFNAPFVSFFVNEKIEFAAERGVILVASAGNSAGDVTYPASHPLVIAVGATNENDRRWEFSCFSDDSGVLPIAAPGERVLSTVPPASDIGDPRFDRYYSLPVSGTSFSAPLVSGVVALLLSIDDSLTREDVIEILIATAKDVWVAYPGEGDKPTHRWKRLNAYRAVAETWKRRYFLENAEPVAVITKAGSGVTPAVGQPVPFEALVDDLEDRPLADEQIIWSSSIDGQMGFGRALEYDALSPGTHTILVTVTDSAGATGSDSVSLVIDERPTAEDQAVTVPFGTPRTITLIATDLDGGPEGLTFGIVSSPSHGSLSSIVGNHVTYTPDSGYAGPDSFTFKAYDGADYSNVATVSITISGTVTYTLTLSNVGNGKVRINGTLRTLLWSGTFDAGQTVSLEAAPDSGWNFSHWSGDLTGSANPTSIAMNEDKSVTVNFSQQAQTYILSLSRTGNGRLRVNGTLRTLPWSETFDAAVSVGLEAVPDSGWIFSSWSGALSGSANPTNIIMSGDKTVVAMFQQEGPGGNEPPVASHQIVTAPYPAVTPIAIELVASDPDTGPADLEFTIVSLPTHGSVSSPVGNQVIYTPNPTYSGLDNFTFKANDGADDSNIATVSVIIYLLESEPNDSIDQATPLTVPIESVVGAGGMGDGSAVDYFSFTGVSGQAEVVFFEGVYSTSCLIRGGNAVVEVCGTSPSVNVFASDTNYIRVIATGPYIFVLQVVE